MISSTLAGGSRELDRGVASIVLGLDSDHQEAEGYLVGSDGHVGLSLYPLRLAHLAGKVVSDRHQEA